MTTITLIITILSAVSASFIISSEYVFEWLRKLVIKTKLEWLITFVHCPVCLSFWMGLFVGLLVGGFTWWCIATAFVSALCARIIKLLE